MGGAAEAAGVPAAGVRALVGHGRARAPRALPDADADPAGARGPGGQGSAGRTIYISSLVLGTPTTLIVTLTPQCVVSSQTVVMSTLNWVT